ncbi:uncharacterized protein LOC135936438 [Cloeon dipterum]|uniref:uncharacterized protein LOC135936438 n=1 Tax=Cloeon dipterum TaxID=197152 RepID=UPI00321F8BF8
MVPPIKAKKSNGDGNSADSSIVWHIFKKTSNPKAAYCLKCKKEYRTGGGTSNLRKHFFTKHKDIFDLISGSARSRTANTSKENIEDDSEERTEEVLSDTDEEEFVLGRKRSRPIIEDSNDEEDSNTVGAHSTREASLEKALPEVSKVTKMMSQSKSMMVPEKKQLTIPEAHLRKESYSKGGAKQMKLTMWLLKGQSMGLVKENFFMMESSKDWLKQMFPLYETVPEEMIEETQELMFKTYHIFAKEKLKNAKTYSLTVDVKERAAMDTYVELTAVIPADAENSLVYLPLSHLKVVQCSEVQLITFIKKTLSSFGLLDKTMGFLLFSGRKSIFEDLDKSTEKTFQSVAKFQCLKDILSEILSDALNDSSLINELFERVSEIIQFIQTSDELLDAAKRAGSTHEKDKKTMEYLLKLPFADSTDLSLYTTFAAISGSLSKLITDSQLYECPNLLSLADNKTLKESVDVLQPLQAFSSQLRSPKMPLLISEYIPLLVTIRTCITKVDVLCEGALELKKNILGKLSSN